MELNQLKTFRMVAETLSFTETAAMLNYAQSSVTAQVRALEDELGKPLFNRLGRQIQLTDAGHQLLWYAERMLSLADQAHTVVSDDRQVTGAISIGAPETVCTYVLPSILRKFRDRFPQVQVSFRPMSDAELPRNIRSGALDVALVLREPLESNGLVVENLRSETLLVLAGADHPATRLTRVIPADLSTETFLLTESGCGYRHLFERALASAGVYPATKLELSSVEVIKHCAMAGLGIAFLPRMAVAEELERGLLCALNWFESYEVYMQMVWHKNTWLSLPLTEFLETSRSLLRHID